MEELKGASLTSPIQESVAQRVEINPTDIQEIAQRKLVVEMFGEDIPDNYEDITAAKEEKVIQGTTALILNTVEELVSKDQSVEELEDTWITYPFLGIYLALPNQMPIENLSQLLDSISLARSRARSEIHRIFQEN